MVEENYQGMLGIANALVNPLLEEAVDIEVHQSLEEMGFAREENNSVRLKYVGKNVEIFYDYYANEPFSIRLDKNDSDAVSEAGVVSSKLIETLEDI